MTPRFPILVGALAAGLALAAPAAAQSADDAHGPNAKSSEAAEAGGSVHDRTAPELLAVRVDSAFRIDGRLDEGEWARVPAASRFVQTDPIDGAPASERTEVRIAYDADAVYVGARLYDRHPVSTRLAGRDAWMSDADWLTVVFDSFHAHQGGYRFRIDPSGVRGDDANGDPSWNPVWGAAVTVDSAGWTVEMRIPFSQLRFDPQNPTWGLQLSRDIARTAEHDVFAYTPKGEPGGAARYGHLTGLAGMSQRRGLELLPYVATRAEMVQVPRATASAFANPFRSGHDVAPDAGVDLKLGITPNLTLDGTFNPDFGQVEADAAQVNLSASESYFGEQRPFFIEGSSIFAYGWGELFYSRRIGRAPEGAPPSGAVYADVPRATPILGAAKLTGRTANGWSVGVLDAVTPTTSAPWADSIGAVHDAVVAPLSNYFVARVKRDFRQGATTIGGIVTSVARSLGDTALVRELRSDATAAGVDFRTEFDERAWAVSGAVTGTDVRGSAPAITAAEESSIRYYQRPDARYLGVDSTARSLGGYRAILALERPTGVHWRGRISGSATSPGYETNDLGFLTGTDRLSYGSMLEYHDETPGRAVRRWATRVITDASWDFAGDIVGNYARLEQDWTLTDYWSGRFALHHNFTTLSDRLTRGGPLAVTPAWNQVEASLSSDGREPYTMGVSAVRGASPSGGWYHAQSVSLGVKASAAWTASVSPSFSTTHGTAQYVTTVADPTATATYGERYVFADIDQSTLSLPVRMNVTITPTLTVALAAQPLLASGRFGAPKELATPRTYDFSVFGVDAGTIADSAGSYTVDPDGSGPAQAFSFADPSFNTRALNGTASVRWEWRPGSTMYVVWQQQRTSSGDGGDFDVTRDAGELLRTRPDNVFTVKINYWLSL